MINFLKNLFKNFCWHKWKYVYQEHFIMFLGEKCIKKYKKFRICKKCKIAQKHDIAINGEIFWDTLNEYERKILLNKIEDKGDYYILRKS